MKRKKDFREDLEKAARQMILVHRVDTLARLIVRYILRNIRVNHAGILIYDKLKNEYIVKVSKGEKGIKIPVGFTKVGPANPLIRYFTDPKFKVFKQDFLLHNRIQYYRGSRLVKANRELGTSLNLCAGSQDRLPLHGEGVYRQKQQ